MIPRRRINFIKYEFLKAIKYVFSKKNDDIKIFKKELSNFFNNENVEITSSGRSGLELILQSLNLKKGDEIIVPAYTLKALIPIIQKFDVTIRFADISKNDFNIDLESIKKNTNKKTRAIIILHSFGMPADIKNIVDFAKNKNIFTIEDCAHSFGSKYKNKLLGTFGDASFFSFENTKPLNIYGGGMILINNPCIKLKKTKIENKKFTFNNFTKIFSAKIENTVLSLGILNPLLFLFTVKGFNSFLIKLYFAFQPKPKKKVFTNLQANMGIIKLFKVEERIKKRQDLVKIYQKNLSNKIELQEKTGFSSYYFLTGLIKKDTYDIKRKLLFKGIDIGIMAEVTDNCQVSYPEISKENNLKNTNHIFNQVIQLPLYDSLKEKEIIKICKKLNKLIE